MTCFTLIALMALWFGFFVSSVAGQSEIVDPAACVYPNDAPPPQPLFGLQNASRVLQDTELLSQPPYSNDIRPIEIASIPAGAYVVVLGLDDATRNWFRVLWLCEDRHVAGWLRAETVQLSARRANVEYAPASCASPIVTVDSLDATWQSTVDGRITLVMDLFRHNRVTDFPRSFFYITRNGDELRDQEREIRSAGSVLVRGLELSIEVNHGDEIGFALVSSSADSVELFATLYAVAPGCSFFDTLPFAGSVVHPLFGWQSQEFMIIDEREVLGSVFVEASGTIDNRAGTEDLMQDVAAWRQFRFDVELDLDDDRIDPRDMEGRILSAYDFPSNGDQKVCLISVNVPAGEAYAYNLQWSQILREGTIYERTSHGLGAILGTYRLVTDLQCEILGFEERS